MKRDALILLGAAVGITALTAMYLRSGIPSADAAPAATTVSDEVVSTQVLHYDMDRIDGSPENLSAYQGKVVLLVNVASKCGLTRQYEGLEALYEELKDEGFVILGFPANNFMGQEPGSNEEIAEFCRSTYGVQFPMFAKIDVNGDKALPLFDHLKREKPGLLGASIKWNFTKFLVDRAGKVVARYGSTTSPGALSRDIEKLL